MRPNHKNNTLIKGQSRLNSARKVITSLSYNPDTEVIAFATATHREIGQAPRVFLEMCANRPNSAVVFVLTPVIKLVAMCTKRCTTPVFDDVKSFKFCAELSRNEPRVYNQGRRADIDGVWHNLFLVFVGAESWELWLTQEDADRLMPIVFN